jgi:hypothetical protein
VALLLVAVCLKLVASKLIVTNQDMDSSLVFGGNSTSHASSHILLAIDSNMVPPHGQGKKTDVEYPIYDW